MNQSLEAPATGGAGLPAETRPAEAAAPPEPASASVAVEIYDGVYHLRGTDPAYIERLAAIVDTKMRAVSAHGGTVDSLRVAVLAALNIADELATLRQRHEALASSLRQSQNSIRTRAGSLAGMLDEVLLDDSIQNRQAG